MANVLFLRLSAALIGLSGLSAQAQAACTIAPIAELPVTMAGHRPMISANINGTDVQFLADSGAFYSVITPGSAAELKLHLDRAPPQFAMRGVGGLAEAWLTKVKATTLAGVTIPNLTFLVTGSETGGVGLLGQNVFGLADVEYDLGSGMIRLLRPKDCKGLSLAYWAAGKPVSVLPISTPSPTDPHTIGKVTINGVEMRAVFDTGAGTSVLTLAAAARAGIHPDDKGVISAGYSGGIGRKAVQTWVAPFASFKIGDGEEIRNAHLRIGDMGLMQEDMLIGADFFLSHRVYVANSQHQLYFTYNGGPVFNLVRETAEQGANEAAAAVGAPATAADPTDADGFARRGTASAARRDFAHAAADLTRAVEMAPGEPQYLVQRAEVRLALRQPLLASADLDQALKLKADNVPALILRARMRAGSNDRAGALADLDAAARAASPDSDSQLALAQSYSRIDAFDQAVARYDLWIARHTQDFRQAEALNGRAWTLALAGRDLDKALRDANSAIRIMPKTASFFDTRGLVKLRRGQFDDAIADYDVAVAGEPRSAWSLYGRGLAKLRKGMIPEGKADIAAAMALQPTLPERAKRYGLAAP